MYHTIPAYDLAPWSAPIFEPPVGAPLFALPTSSRAEAARIVDELLMLAVPPCLLGIIDPDDPECQITLYLWFLSPQSEMSVALLGFAQARRISGPALIPAWTRLSQPALVRILQAAETPTAQTVEAA